MSEITVIMPVYNGELFIEEAIDSILSQTFSNFILLIINDNSTDGTQEIIERYLKQDNRVKYLKNDINLGAAISRNIAIDLATTEYIALMDADDKAITTRFEKQLNFLKSHPEIGVCGAGFQFFGDKDRVIKHSEKHDEIKVDFLSHCAIQNSTAMLRRLSLGNLRFDENMIVAEDYSLWSQLIAKTKFHNLQEVLVLYRWHEKNISQTEGGKLEAYEFTVRTRQLERLDIHPDDPNLAHYIFAISLKRNESKESIIKTIKAANELKLKNKKYKYFNQEIFEKHVDNTIIRTIRNSKTTDKEFYRYIKRDSGYFNKMPKLDIVNFFLKSHI